MTKLGFSNQEVLVILDLSYLTDLSTTDFHFKIICARTRSEARVTFIMHFGSTSIPVTLDFTLLGLIQWLCAGNNVDILVEVVSIKYISLKVIFLLVFTNYRKRIIFASNLKLLMTSDSNHFGLNYAFIDSKEFLNVKKSSITHTL